MKKIINCKICKKPLSGRKTMFCSTHCKNKAHQSYPAQKARGLARKVLLVKTLGGKCSKCGYQKNLAALTFHHNDPSIKAFKLDMRSLSNRRPSVIQNEFEKCILVCHNCHAELHYPQHTLAQNC